MESHEFFHTDEVRSDVSNGIWEIEHIPESYLHFYRIWITRTNNKFYLIWIIILVCLCFEQHYKMRFPCLINRFDRCLTVMCSLHMTNKRLKIKTSLSNIFKPNCIMEKIVLNRYLHSVIWIDIIDILNYLFRVFLVFNDFDIVFL